MFRFVVKVQTRGPEGLRPARYMAASAANGSDAIRAAKAQLLRENEDAAGASFVSRRAPAGQPFPFNTAEEVR